MTLLVTSINSLLMIVGSISVLMIITGGIRYTTSGGDQGSVKAAKDTILYALVGLVTAIFAYAVVNIVLSGFVTNGPPAISSAIFGYITAGFALIASGLRWLRRLPRWIAVVSACCLPKAERPAHINEIWAALIEEPSLVKRTQMAVTAVVAAPRSGWYARKRRLAEEVEWARIA